MAPKTVHVKALKTFDMFVEGDKYLLVLTERVAELIALDYLQLLKVDG